MDALLNAVVAFKFVIMNAMMMEISILFVIFWFTLYYSKRSWNKFIFRVFKKIVLSSINPTPGRAAFIINLVSMENTNFIFSILRDAVSMILAIKLVKKNKFLMIIIVWVGAGEEELFLKTGFSAQLWMKFILGSTAAGEIWLHLE